MLPGRPGFVGEQHTRATREQCGTFLVPILRKIHLPIVPKGYGANGSVTKAPVVRVHCNALPWQVFVHNDLLGNPIE